MKLEVVVIPVSDVDRAKRFYGDSGLEARHRLRGRRRLPGDPVHPARLRMFGHLRQERYRSRARLMHRAAPDRLRHSRPPATNFSAVASRSASHSTTPAAYSIMLARKDLVSGPNPQRKSYASYASFSDPDGNGWVLQEVTARLTGHIAAGDTSFTPELTNVVRRAEADAMLMAGRDSLRALFQLPRRCAMWSVL